MEHRADRRGRRAAAAASASLVLGLMLFLPRGAAAGCMEGKKVACVDETGCAGFSTCIGGEWSECMAICAPPPPPSDLFTTFNSPSDTTVGICVDGQGAWGPVNDQNFLLPASGGDTTFRVGALTSSTTTNEVIAFAVGRAPTWTATPWTSAVDIFRGPIDNTVQIGITVWVVQGPFEDEAVQALETAIAASGIFRIERAGIALAAINVIDVTNHANAPAALDGASQWALRAVGFHTNRLNIYWVNTVNGGSGNGVNWDGTPVIAVGHNAEGGLLAHECGHAFVLEHTDGQPGYDGTNVMASSASNRLYLTEGQNFRMHFHPSSQLNAAYRARPNKPSRVCSRDTADRLCLRNDKRLWADGAFPAN